MSQPVEADTPDTNQLPDQHELESLVEHILDEAKAQGATSAEAAVSYETGLSTTVRLGEVETLEYNRDRGLAVTVYFGHRKGTASTGDLSREAVTETVQRACTIARYTAEDPAAGLADAALMAREVPELELYFPWSVTPDAAIELALACEGVARGYDKRIVNSEGASVSSHSSLFVYGNSHGFIGGYPTTRQSMNCFVIGREGDQMQRDYWYTVARDKDDLESAEAVGRQAAERTVARLGARRLSTRQAPVLYESNIASGLLGHLGSAISGSRLYRDASFLANSLGQRLFPSFVRIHEQPHLKKALGSAPFDNEGVATAPRDVVTGGVLEGYILDSYSARKLAMQTTANAGGVHNLTIEPGDKDHEGLLREMGTGLLLTELMGMGINLVTGDYSRGAAGFWVEDGEIAYPVHEITVAGNLRDMFSNLVAVGNDVDIRGNIRTGSLLVDNMTIAGE